MLWPDTWNNYFHPQVLGAAHEVLGSAGFQVQFPAQHICCGRPLYDFGFLDQARTYLEKILDRLGPQIDSGMPFVVLEPSCASVFRDELINFFPTNERALRLAKQTFLLSGQGDVIAPDGAVAAIGSGGPYAQAAAQALAEHTQLSARQIAEEAMKIAGKMCIYTNDKVTIEEL